MCCFICSDISIIKCPNIKCSFYRNCYVYPCLSALIHVLFLYNCYLLVGSKAHQSLCYIVTMSCRLKIKLILSYLSGNIRTHGCWAGYIRAYDLPQVHRPYGSTDRGVRQLVSVEEIASQVFPT